MPATKTTAQRVSAAARAQAKKDAQRLERITKSLEAAQKDLGSIGDRVGTGVRDLRRDVTKMLRDARRDLTKMRRSIERDLDRLQKDLASAGAAPSARGGRARPATTSKAKAATTPARKKTAASSSRKKAA